MSHRPNPRRRRLQPGRGPRLRPARGARHRRGPVPRSCRCGNSSAALGRGVQRASSSSRAPLEAPWGPSRWPWGPSGPSRWPCPPRTRGAQRPRPRPPLSAPASAARCPSAPSAPWARRQLPCFEVPPDLPGCLKPATAGKICPRAAETGKFRDAVFWACSAAVVKCGSFGNSFLFPKLRRAETGPFGSPAG